MTVVASLESPARLRWESAYIGSRSGGGRLIRYCRTFQILHAATRWRLYHWGASPFKYSTLKQFYSRSIDSFENIGYLYLPNITFASRALGWVLFFVEYSYFYSMDATNPPPYHGFVFFFSLVAVHQRVDDYLQRYVICACARKVSDKINGVFNTIVQLWVQLCVLLND